MSVSLPGTGFGAEQYVLFLFLGRERDGGNQNLRTQRERGAFCGGTDKILTSAIPDSLHSVGESPRPPTARSE